MILWIIAGLWRADFERWVDLEVRDSACGFRHRDQSVWYDVFEVNAVFDN